MEDRTLLGAVSTIRCKSHPTGCARAGGEKRVASTVWLRALLEITLAGCSHLGVHSAGSISPTRGLQVRDQPATFVYISP